MGAPKIRQLRKEAIRQQRSAHARLRELPLAIVTVVQDEITREVLGVLIDRNAFPAWQEKVGVDLSHAELIDKVLVV